MNTADFYKIKKIKPAAFNLLVTGLFFPMNGSPIFIFSWTSWWDTHQNDLISCVNSTLMYTAVTVAAKKIRKWV